MTASIAAQLIIIMLALRLYFLERTVFARLVSAVLAGIAMAHLVTLVA